MQNVEIDKTNGMSMNETVLVLEKKIKRVVHNLPTSIPARSIIEPPDTSNNK